MNLANKQVLVTGGAGFIGSHIVDRCLELGAEKVIALDNFVSGKKEFVAAAASNKRFQLIEGDVTNQQLINDLVKNSDLVLHNAASKMVVSLEQPRIDLRTNIVGTFNVLEAARNSNARVIHASTGSVFGSSEQAMAENHPKSPTSLYGISKLAADNYCLFYAKELGVKVSVLRYFHVFGPRQDYSGEAGVVNIFLSRVLQGKPPIIYSGGNQIRCLTYVSDTVEANFILAADNSSIGQDYNVASKTRISINELAEYITEKYAKTPLTPKAGKDRVGENMKPIPDTSKIEALGWSAKVSFEDGLEKCKAWIEDL